MWTKRKILIYCSQTPESDETLEPGFELTKSSDSRPGLEGADKLVGAAEASWELYLALSQSLLEESSH